MKYILKLLFGGGTHQKPDMWAVAISEITAAKDSGRILFTKVRREAL